MKFLITFILTFLSSICFSQDTYYLKELKTKTKIEGLIRDMFEDKWGMIWMLTYDRIIRYDGRDFEMFDDIIKPDLRLRNASLIDDRILLNYEHRVLKLFDIRTLRLNDIELPDEIKAPSFISAYHNNIYICSKLLKCLFICKLENKQLKILKKLDNLETDEVVATNDSMVVTRNYHESYILFIKTDGVTLRRIDNYGATSLTYYSNHIFLNNGVNTWIYDIDKGSYKWVSNFFGNFSSYMNKEDLYMFSNESDYKMSLKDLKLQRVKLITVSNEKKDWARTFLIYTTSNNIKYVVNSLGVFRLMESKPDFSKNIITSYIDEKKNYTNVRCINYNSRDGNVYLGMDNENGILISNLFDSLHRFRKLKLPNVPNMGISNTINSIFIDNTNVVFGSTIEAFKLTAEKLEDAGYSWCRDIYKDSLGQFWIAGSTHRLCKKFNNGNLKIFWIKNQNDTFLFVKNHPFDIKYITETQVHTAFPDFKTWDIEPYQHYFFISSTMGLLTFDRNTETFLDTRDFLHMKDSISASTWHSKVVGDYLYVATQGEGIYKINLKTGVYAKPIPDNLNTYMVESFDGKNVWITSEDKLTYLQNDDKYFELPVSNYPLPEELAFHGLCNIDGRNFFVSGRGGFTVINAPAIIKAIFNSKSKTLIKEYKVNDIVYGSYLESRSSLSFPYDSSSLIFDVANTFLDNADQMKLKYKLIGYEDNFTESSGNNSIVYKSLPYGNYKLEIYSRNSNAQWDNEPIVLNITIRPPWYRNIYAKIGYVLLFITAGLLTYYRLMQRMEQKRKTEQALIESELKAIRAQINPHFMFNALNSIQSFIMENEKKEANNYLSVFSQLVRKVLDVSSKDLISVEKETSWMKDYLSLEALRFDTRLDWRIDIDPELSAEDEIPSMVLQPVIENAMIHGLFPKPGAGHLTIRYARSDNRMVLCEVIDDGVGRSEKKKEHESKGMSLIRNRLEYISKRYRCNSMMETIDLTGDDGNPAGTHVKIWLPLV
jgi:two-component sensor histidine kinase